MSVDLTSILRDWEYDEEENMRVIQADDGRSVLQVRQPLGIEQYELDGRPDGERPSGNESFLEGLNSRLEQHLKTVGGDDGFELSHDDCVAMQAEGVLYYYRYLLLFQLNDFERVIRDTGHNLRICELLESYCSDEDDRNAVLQFKPYIVRMNAMARAMLQAREDDPAEARRIIDQAIQDIQALDKIETPAFQFERVRSVNYLRQAREQLTDEPDPRAKLENELQQAVEQEDYELAALLRDQIRELK